jgi:hypothetical protein
LPAVGKRKPDAGRIVYHMAVGQNQPIGSEHKAGSTTVPFAWLAIMSLTGNLNNFNLRDRRTYPFRSRNYGVGISVQQSSIIVRRRLKHRFVFERARRNKLLKHGW